LKKRDFRVLLIFRNRNVEKLTNLLTKNFVEDEQKARAIFRWITEYIAYDCKGFLKPIKSKSKPKQVLGRRKGICYGYSALFKEMCDIAGIKCEIINGYAKQSVTRKCKNNIIIRDHSWNAIYLNDKWYLLDATWASGVVDNRCIHFSKKYNKHSSFGIKLPLNIFKHFEKCYTEYYFLSSPQDFILEHFPKKNNWQLLENTIDIRQFKNASQLKNPPHIYERFFEEDIKSFLPECTTIETRIKKNTEIKFKGKDHRKISSINIFKQEDSLGYFVPFNIRLYKQKNKRIYYIRFTKKGTYYVIICLDNMVSFPYKIIVKENINSHIKVTINKDTYNKNINNKTSDTNEITDKQQLFINNLLFEYNKSTLSYISISELNKIFDHLNTKNEILIEIIGHTCNIGSVKYNLKLSENRAKVVANYLIENGIDKKRIIYKGLAESFPIKSNETEAGRKMNRRVELVLK